MKILPLILLFLIACSPESILTPDECKVESIIQEKTYVIDMSGGESEPEPDVYIVTMSNGRKFTLTEQEAIDAMLDPEKACAEIMGI